MRSERSTGSCFVPFSFLFPFLSGKAGTSNSKNKSWYISSRSPTRLKLQSLFYFRNERSFVSIFFLVSLLHAACCTSTCSMLRVARCALHAACCMLRVACCALLHAACWVLHAACCVLHAACCMLHAARCMLHAECCVLRAAACCMLHAAACCMLRVACCALLHAACCALHAVCSVLRAACCPLHAACCVLRVTCCVLCMLRVACSMLHAVCCMLHVALYFGFLGFVDHLNPTHTHARTRAHTRARAHVRTHTHTHSSTHLVLDGMPFESRTHWACSAVSIPDCPIQRSIHCSMYHLSCNAACNMPIMIVLHPATKHAT